MGKGDNEQANKTASTSLFSGLLVGAIIIIGIMVFLDPVLTSLGSTETILPYAKIYVTGSIINVFTVMMNNLLTAQGATKFTMIAMLTGSIANVILDLIMIYGMDLGIEGAAIATVIFLCINMALYIGYIAKKKGVLRFSVKNIAPSKTIYAEVLKIGIPVLLFQLLASAAMGAVTRIMTVVTYVVFGFLKGFQPFAGYNYGAKKYERLKKSIRLCMIWSTVFCVIAAIILIAFANPTVSLFGTDVKMIDLAAKSLRFNVVLFITFGFQMVYASNRIPICSMKLWA